MHILQGQVDGCVEKCALTVSYVALSNGYWLYSLWINRFFCF